MYNVSNGYLTAFKKPVHRWKIRGTVGNVAFDNDNILTGSFHLSNSCSGNDEITLGMAAIGVLSATFVGLNISRYAWKNKDITVEIGLTKAGGTVEYVPAGIYRITDAEWSSDGVSVTAYDNMRLFDKPFLMELGTVDAYTLLKYCCDQCGVTFGMADLTGFCNASMVYPTTYGAEIETYRDLIYWIAQTQCAFATIDRTGALVLRRFVSSSVDTISADERYNSSRFSDYQTKYTGMSVVNTEDGTTSYFSLTPDDGVTINLGQNPLLQRIRSEQETIIGNMLQEMANVQYTPFTATMLGGIHYDLGDVLTENGGLGDGSTCIVTGYDYNYNVGFEMYGVGSNPDLANAQSKSDKNIQNLLANTNKNEFRDYEQRNFSEITIGDTEDVRILWAWLASNTATKALIHVEINLESMANVISDEIDVDILNETVSGDDIFRLVSDKETKGIIRYVVNNDEAPFKPVEQWTDGKHVLHLMYVLPLAAGIATQFRIYMRADGGQIIIPESGLWFYASGRGLVGDGHWNGIIEVEEQAEEWRLVEITFDGATENVSVDVQTPVGISVSDIAAEWNLGEIGFVAATDTVLINLFQKSQNRVTEDDTERITEDGEQRITEGN